MIGVMIDRRCYQPYLAVSVLMEAQPYRPISQVDASKTCPNGNEPTEGNFDSGIQVTVESRRGYPRIADCPMDLSLGMD